MNELENLLPSIIILKNSTVSGKIPIASDLEIGEVALTLAKDEEGLWIKNSSDEVLNLINPKLSSFWGNIFIKYDTKEEFQEDLENVDNNSIIFIEEGGTIWNNGVFYSGDDKIKDVVKLFFIALKKEIIELTIDSSNETISEAFDGIDGFLNIFNKSKELEASISYLNLSDGGKSPVTIIPSIDENGGNKLRFSWIIYDSIFNLEILLKDDVFSVLKKEEKSIVTIERLISELENKQDLLISGENIKTINGISILGPGNINITTGEGGNDKTYIGGNTDTIEVSVDNELNIIKADLLPNSLDSIITEESIDLAFDEVFKPLN